MKAHLAKLLMMLSVGLATTQVHAQSWPTKPLRVIVPFAAGTVTDVLPRIVFEEISTRLGQSIVVENRTGAGGTSGASLVAKADPDGYTLLATSSAHTIAPALYPSLSYHPARDFVAVAALGMLPSVLVVSTSKGPKTVADFVKAGRTQPGGMTFGSAGVGSATHLSAMRLLVSAGVQAIHVPFKGGPEIISEIIAGRIDFFVAPVANALPFVQDAKLAPLVVNGKKRSVALPDVPTTAEAGLVDAEYSFWIALFAPARTPRDVIDKLHAEVSKALATPKVQDKLVALAIDPMGMTPQEFDALIDMQIASDAALARAAGLKSQ